MRNRKENKGGFMLNKIMLFFAGLSIVALFVCADSGNTVPADAASRQTTAVSSDGAVKVTVPAKTVFYSDTAKKKPVSGPITTNIYNLKGIPATDPNMPNAPGFKPNVTISPAAQNGWLTGDVTKGVDSVVAVADIIMTNGKEQVSALSSPVTVNLKLPTTYTPGQYCRLLQFRHRS